MKKVTIAVPTLNRAEYLRLAVTSALGQTYENLEVLVSDNASTDHTEQVLEAFAREPRLRVLKHSVTVSMVDNWNSCITAATGEYFLLLSDDDLLHPEAIAAMTECFSAGGSVREDVGIVYCRGRTIDETGEVISTGPAAPASESAKELILNFFKSQRPTWACTILFQTADIRRGYSNRFPLATDAALWMRVVAQRGRANFLDRPLASYRVHQNISAKTPTASWQAENLALAQYAVERLRDTATLTASEEQAVWEACKRLNIRLVANLLNQNFKRKRGEGLRAYIRHWRDFASFYGMVRACRGLLLLILPASALSLGRSLKRLQPR